MNEIQRLVTNVGGVADYRAMDAMGIPRSVVREAVRTGGLVPVRSRWFASPLAHPDVVRAVRVGGVLTGASVARTNGLWLLSDDLLHVRVRSTASRLSSPDDRATPLAADLHKVCVHYSLWPKTSPCVDSVGDAIVEMFRCGDGRSALAALDSALNKRLLGQADLARMRPRIPLGKLWIFDRADAGAQSGLESLVRLLLATTRVQHRTQVWIAPAGRVDILIGDRLVLELDGRTFHTGEAFEDDRRRDFALIMQGYLVLRISYQMVMNRWDEVAAGILHLVRRNEHRWGRATSAGPFAFTFAG
ncbi:DUF559 domain-containing protein [Leifsonia sp. YIM 134122]|uniref:DUF559 domain-containing protein n=1 Tax=Leifsonia stereocauli TaxID=3134136 RepID=A0ABU9W6E4_9MICO